jgi:hypothetical protein
MSDELLDCLGRRRSPAATSAFHAGRTPRNGACAIPPIRRRSRRSWRSCAPPAPAPTAIGCAASSSCCGAPGCESGKRSRSLRPTLTPAGFGADPPGQGGKRREVGMDGWGWRQLEPWLEYRRQLPVGPPVSAFCTAPAAAAPGRPPRSVGSCAAPAPGPGCAAGWRPISSATPTPSRWPTRGCRWSSSSASLGTPTSGSRASICRALTAPKSSTPSTTAPRQSYPPAPALRTP